MSGLLLALLVAIPAAADTENGYQAAAGDRTKERTVQESADNQPAACTGLVYDHAYLRHKTGAGHPERPERLTAIMERLDQSGLLAKLKRLKSRSASREWITTVHRPDYVDRVKRSCEAEIGWVDSPDAPASSESYEIALGRPGACCPPSTP